MNAATQPLNSTTGADGRGQLEIAEADIELVAEASEKVRKQIRMQANEVGPVLEALLHDTHGHIRWGLNE
jgi:hypothetical protein